MLPTLFALQLLAAALAIPVGRRLARAPKPLWATTAALAFTLLLAWPALRFFPVPAINALGAPLVAAIELTGLAVPAALLFAVAGPHLPRPSDQRALWFLLVVAGVYFVRAGLWMVQPLPPLGRTVIQNGVCLQTTGYTCVAASMVTLLRAHGLPATEDEMARLACVGVGSGATDARCLWGLQRKLALHPEARLRPRYLALDRAALIAAPKPCLVQVDWSYFVSHMVPVTRADADGVRLADPAKGDHDLSWDDFLRKWKGQAIILEPAAG